MLKQAYAVISNLFFMVVPLAGIAAYAIFHRRHRCIHNDPLCRRDRPCIACYRALFMDPENRDSWAIAEREAYTAITGRALASKRSAHRARPGTLPNTALRRLAGTKFGSRGTIESRVRLAKNAAKR